ATPGRPASATCWRPPACPPRWPKAPSASAWGPSPPRSMWTPWPPPWRGWPPIWRPWRRRRGEAAPGDYAGAQRHFGPLLGNRAQGPQPALFRGTGGPAAAGGPAPVHGGPGAHLPGPPGGPRPARRYGAGHGPAGQGLRCGGTPPRL